VVAEGGNSSERFNQPVGRDASEEKRLKRESFAHKRSQARPLRRLQCNERLHHFGGEHGLPEFSKTFFLEENISSRKTGERSGKQEIRPSVRKAEGLLRRRDH